MEPQRRGVWIWDWLWFLALGAASSAWCVTAARELGATFDEPVYVAQGLEFWRTGSHAGLMKLGTMPLAVDLDTLPLYLWEQWHGVTIDPEKDLDRFLPWARAGTLVFWWLLLFYARLAGRQLAGPWAGRLAVALLCCEPSLLAHASLATTDVAVSACLLALVYHFRSGRNSRWFWRVGVPAIWFAGAVLAKASGLVFGPLCLMLIELEQRFTGSAQGADPPPSTGFLHGVWTTLFAPRFRHDLLQIGFLGMALVFLYCGCDWRTQPHFIKWAESLPEGMPRQVMVWLAENLRIFSNAGEGLVRQIKHNVRGHGTFLLGVSADRSIWYYFPVALTMKVSVTLLALPVVLALVRPRSLGNWACLAALVLLVFSLTCRVQIGIRLMLPLVVLAVVGLAAAVVRAHEGLTEDWSRLLAGAICAGVAWSAAAAVQVWPNGLCYVNRLWGGTQQGYRCLSDSNYDWGQGLKELARWQRRHRLATLDVWYFGTDPLLKKLPMRQVPLHLPPLPAPDQVRRRVPGRFVAASTTMVYGNLTHSAEHRRAAAFFRAREPMDRTTTFLIYDLSGE
jgi:hypothetical protein